MDKLIETLKIHEGVRNHVYKCSMGYETIGVGRNISDSGIGLSEEEIDYLLLNDIKRIIEELDSAFDWFTSLDKVRQEAMINLCFNLGLTRLRGFVNALEAMSQANYKQASLEFLDSRWARQVGHRAREVAYMIETGDYYGST